MARDDIELDDQLDRQWDTYLQSLPGQPDASASEHDVDRLVAIRRLHALDTTRVANASRDRVWQSVTMRLSQEERMNGAHPITPVNGNGRATGYLYPPEERSEPVRTRRRWWPAVEFSAMVALIAVLLVSLATDGRFIPFRQDPDSTGSGLAPLSGGSVVDIPFAGGAPAEVMLRRLTFEPGASWQSVPGLVVVTLVESGSLTYSSAKGTTSANTAGAGSAFQSNDAALVRNDGEEPAVALQGIVSYTPVLEPVLTGVTEDLLARHVTDSIAGGWTFVQLDRVSLAPGTSVVDPAQDAPNFTRAGQVITLAAVESGAVTLFGTGSQGEVVGSAGGANAEAGVVAGSQGGDTRANADPIMGTAAGEPGFGVGGSGAVSSGSDGEFGDAPGIGGANTAGGIDSQFGGIQTANVETEPGARSGGRGANDPRPDTVPEGGAKARAGNENAFVVTGIGGEVSATPDPSVVVARVVPANASGIVASSGTTEIRNTGPGTAVVAIFTLVPGDYKTEDVVSSEAEVNASGD